MDPDLCWWTCEDTRLHLLAGVGLALILHLPLAPHAFRDTLGKRLLLVAVIGFVYELGQWDVAHSLGLAGTTGFGVSPKDLLANITGAVVVEYGNRLRRRLWP